MGRTQQYTSLGHTQLQLSVQSLFTLLVGNRNQAAGIDGLTACSTAAVGPAQQLWDPHSPLICFPPEDQSPLDKTTTNKIQSPSPGKLPAPVQLPHSYFPWGWPLCIHVLLSPPLPALHAARDPQQLPGLNAAQCSPLSAPQPLQNAHSLVPNSSALHGAGCSPCAPHTLPSASGWAPLGYQPIDST